MDKTERIVNQLEIWNLTEIRAEVVEQVGTEEIAENHFAMLAGKVKGEQVQSSLISGKNKLRFRFFGTFKNSEKEIEILLQKENLNVKLENKSVLFEGKSDIIVENLQENSTLTVSVKECPHVKPVEIKIDVLPIHLEAKNIEDNEFEIKAFNKEGKFTEETQILWKSADFVQSGTTTPLGTVGNWKMPASTTVAVVEIITNDIKIVAEITVAEERKTISDIIRLPRKKEGQVLIMATRNYEMEIAQTGRLEGIAGENTRLNARLVYTYNVPPFDSNRHQILQWEGFPSRRVVVKDEKSTFLNNLKIKWTSGNGGSFSPQITSFNKEQNGEWHATTEWRAGEKGLEAVTMELLGTLSNLQEEQVSNEDKLRLQQQEQELKSQLQQQNKIFVEELTSIVNNLRSAINGNRTENERIRQDNEEKEKRIQEQIKEQQQKTQEAIALLESQLKKLEKEEGDLLAEGREFERISNELDEFFVDIESEHVDLDVVDIRIDPEFIDKLLINAQDEFEQEFIIKNVALLKKEEKKRISDEKIAQISGPSESSLRSLLVIMNLRNKIFEKMEAMPEFNEVFEEIQQHLMEELDNIITQAVLAVIISIDLDEGTVFQIAIEVAFAIILPALHKILKMAKILKKLNTLRKKLEKLFKKFDELLEKLEEVMEKFEEAQDIIEKISSGDIAGLTEESPFSLDGLTKKKNRKKNKNASKDKKDDNKDKEKRKAEKKQVLQDLKKITEKLEKQLKDMAEFAKSESAKAKEAIAKFATTKLKAIQNLFKMKKTIGCFSGETLVHTTKGLQPIKNIKQGDKVYGTDINKNKFTTTNNFVLSTTRKIVFTLLILFLGSNTIETTPEHPFWVVEKGWTEAKDIREGDLVQTINNEQIAVERIEKRRGQFEVYNLDVANCDTFFVDKMGVLVHNADNKKGKNKKCPPDTRPKKGELNKDNKIPIIFMENPKNINFSQRSINIRFDTREGKKSIEKVVKDGPGQVKDFPPIKVIKVKGQLVVRDGNSRLYVAVKTKAKEIRCILEISHDSMLDLTKRLRNNGLINTGTSSLPTAK